MPGALQAAQLAIAMAALGPAKHVHDGSLADYYYSLAADSKASQDMREAAGRYALAQAALRHDHAEEALKLSQDAVSLFRGAGNADGAADAVRLLVQAHCSLNDRGEAASVLQQELELARAAGDATWEAKLLLSVAEMAGDRRGGASREEALQAAARARAAFRGQQDKRMEATALLATLILKIQPKDNQVQWVQDVDETAEEALALFQTVSDKRGMAMVLHWKAVLLAGRGRLQAALGSADRARGLFSECHDRVLEARELQVIATWCLEAGLLHLALPAAEEALILFRALGCGDLRVTNALQTVVRCHIANRNAGQALALAMDAAAEAKAAGARRGEADALLLASQGYVNLAKEMAPADEPDNYPVPEEAVAAAEQAFEIIRDLGDEENEARVATFISNLRLRRREFEKASYSAQEALWMLEEAKDAECHAAALHALMSSHLSKNDYKGAVQAAYDTRDIFRKAGAPVKEAQALLTVAEIQFARGSIDEAVAAAREAQLVFHEAGDKQGEGKSMQYIAQIRSANKEHERAVFAAERARLHMQRIGEEEAEARMFLLLVRNRISALQKKREADERIMPGWEDVAKVTRDANELVALCRRVRYKELVASALCAAAQVHAFNDRHQNAIDAADEAVSIFAATEDTENEAAARILCAKLYLTLGDLRKSLQEANEAMRLFEELEDAEGIALVEEVLASLREFEFRVDGGSSAPAASGKARATESAAAAAPRSSEGVLAQARPPGLAPALVISTLQRVTKMMLGSDRDIEADLPLFDVGITSMNAVLFRNKLLDEFEGVDLPVTLVFDFPTLKGMSELVLERSAS